MMRAAVVGEVGAAPEPGDRPAPSGGKGRALVRVDYAALNPIELRVAAGAHSRRPQPPYVPGLEGAGQVVESSGHEIGARVRFESAALPGFGQDGVLAELASVPEDSLVALPAAVDAVTAAAIGVVGVTAWAALERAGVRRGDRVLVLGATGAVGQMGVQIAREMGAGRVVAAGRDAARLARSREAGADEVVELSGHAETAEAFEAAAGGPLDVVLDPLWGPPAMAALRALGTGGRLVNVGQAAGTAVDLPLADLRNRQGAVLTLSSGWMSYADKAALFRRLADLAASGTLALEHEIAPLGDVHSAWERQAASPGTKVVVRASEEAVAAAP